MDKINERERQNTRGAKDRLLNNINTLEDSGVTGVHRGNHDSYALLSI